MPSHIAAPRELGTPMSMIDLFAGCGGMTVGFVAAGFKPALAVEWNLHAAATYAANFGDDHTFCGDIADVTTAQIPVVDVVIGGPPCQGFSNLGTRDPDDPRNVLWREYIRVVEAAQPRVFVIENVDRFLSSSEFQILQNTVRRGRLSGYELRAGILNAADYGTPQRRRRAVVIGSRVGPIELPRPTHAKDGLGGLEPWLGTRAAIGDVPWNTITTDLPYSSTQFKGVQLPGIFKGLDLHVGRRPRELSKLRYEAVPPGGGRFNLPDDLLPDCWRNKPTGTTDVLGRMRWDEPSLTIRTEFFKPEKGAYLHPQWDADMPSLSVNRPITHLEAALLQTFPRDFLWCGSKIEIARQIGNAVPCVLAEAIGRRVRESLGE